LQKQIVSPAKAAGKAPAAFLFDWGFPFAAYKKTIALKC
jgi:hypothetical protein